MAEPIRIAMWSGPRNLSTAMMRSFGARADCAVLDEPFYAAYLARSGIDHPMKAEVLSAQSADPEAVARLCLGPVPGGRAIWYQKHMSHHMLPDFPRDWFAACRHAILIRAPEHVAASFDAGRPRPTLADLGVPQMTGVIADIEAATGRAPPVIEAEDVRANPEGMLRALCAALDLDFDPAMLRWEPGLRASDGVWAAHWYGAVIGSTGFAPPGRAPAPAAHLAEVIAAARPEFERLQAMKLRPL